MQSIDCWPANANNKIEKGEQKSIDRTWNGQSWYSKRNYNIATVGIPTEYTAGIPTWLKVKIKKWNRERETRRNSDEYGVDARNRAKGRGGFLLNSKNRN